MRLYACSRRALFVCIPPSHRSGLRDLSSDYRVLNIEPWMQNNVSLESKSFSSQFLIFRLSY
jgi:hypothetical protein